MKQAGITVATVGVFSWVSLQPAAEQLDLRGVIAGRDLEYPSTPNIEESP